MQRACRSAVLGLAVGLFGLCAPVRAHNVWCHCSFADPKETLEFFHLAGDVYSAHAGAVRAWHDANVPLENGVLAEFEWKVDPSKPLQPNLFRENLSGLQKLDTQFGVLDERLGKVIAFLKAHKASPEFDSALKRVMASGRNIERLQASGSRYAEVGGRAEKAQKQPSIDSVRAIFETQRADLGLLRQKLGEVIAGAREAIPLAEKGEFAQVMLSGRNAFGDKMPQFTDWFSAYDRFYVQSCMATISVTMQVYPKGFEWLKKP